MVSFSEVRCPNCGAPLRLPRGSSPILSGATIRCDFCDMLLAPERGGFRPIAPERAAETLERPSAPRIWLGRHRYWILGRLALGESSDVFLAKRDARINDLVIVKLSRTGDDDLLAGGLSVLEKLRAADSQGANHLRTLLPKPVASGTARLGMQGQEGDCKAQAFRFRSGFVHTFDDVSQAYPGGVSTHAAVWMLKRVLNLLGFVHRAGFVHGSVLPRHLLVHARDHGVTLVGWSRATRRGQALPATVADARVFYPAEVWSGAPTQFGTDLAMTARCVLRALGASYPLTATDPWRAPDTVDRSLGALLERMAASEATGNAWDLKDEVSAIAQSIHGPPKFVPFDMPGWKRKATDAR